MDETLYEKKFLVTLLSSSNAKLLKLVYQTIINQKMTYLNFTIIIIVNSLDETYYNEVCNEFNDIDIEIIETESNGRPGKGHNSIFNIFKKKKQFDYLIPIDGDDFLYPYALHQLSKILVSDNPDILVLQGNDLLSWYNDSNSSTDIYLNNSFYLIKQDEYPENKWRFNLNSVNINPFENDKFITPVRLILCNRNIFSLNITNFYCEDCNVIDDYLFYLHFINIYINKLLKVWVINSNHIYLYNDLSILSVHNTLKLEKDYNYIKSYKTFFNEINNYFGNKWDVLKLPFKYIKPPFNSIFTNYKINNNMIQILNYKEYLENINTKYCITFSKKIVIEIYNIFKINIDNWLSNSKIEQAFKLINKFIENNCEDREIYTYLCLYGYINKNEKLIKKYIHLTVPFSNNYKCLLKYL
jgi:hypothetical protein